MTIQDAMASVRNRTNRVFDQRGGDLTTLHNIWGGWEKWLQGEMLLSFNGANFHLSQEDNIYRDSDRKSADFVIQVPIPMVHDGPEPESNCVIELKAITINQSISAFENLVRDDVIKLCGRLSLGFGNTTSVWRMMIAATIPSKPITTDLNDRIQRYIAGQHGTHCERARYELAGNRFSVSYYWWLQPN